MVGTARKNENSVAAGRDRVAAWTYDPMRRTIEPADDEARWLTEEERAAPPPPAARTRGPRLAAVPAPQPEVAEHPHDTIPVIGAVPDLVEVAQPIAEEDVPGDEPESTPVVAPAAKAPAKSRSAGRRASVPSWDEILFGSAPKRDSD